MAIMPLRRVLNQHSEEAPFLWGLRSAVAVAPHYDLADLAKLDQRVEAHIDGLRVAGDEGWQLCRKELDWKEAGEVFAAAVLAFESGVDDRVAEVLKIGVASLELSRGIVSALGWLDYRQAEPHIKNLFASDSATVRRIGIAASAVHRKDPGRLLQEAISDADPLLKCRALRAVGELGRIDLLALIRTELSAKDDACRFWAAWSVALVAGHTDAVQVLQSFAESPGRYRERALKIALPRLTTHSARAWQKQLASNLKCTRMAVIGAGVMGDPDLIPWLIEQMKIPVLARVAGEAFTMITGVDIAYDDMDAEKPEGFEAGPTEDPADDNVEMDPDDRLPWPDPELIAKWWDQHSSEFHAGTRYLLGKPIAVEWMDQVLRIGRQRQRAAAALELATLQPGQLLFEVRAPGFRQQRMLQLSAGS